MSETASETQIEQRIREDQIRQIAQLARLQLSSEEITRFTEQLTQILKYARNLQGVHAEDIEPYSEALSSAAVGRADDPRPSLTPEQALANAASVFHHCFYVPPLLPRECAGEATGS